MIEDDEEVVQITKGELRKILEALERAHRIILRSSVS